MQHRPGCTLNFHPLCARRNGWLLSEAASRTTSDTRSVVVTPWPSGAVLRLVGIHAVGGGGRGRGRPPLRPRRSRWSRAQGWRVQAQTISHAMRWSCSAPVTDSSSTREGAPPREAQAVQSLELQTELWSMQMAGLDDGGGATTEISPPPSPSRLRAWMTPRMADSLNATLPLGYAYQPESP